MKLFMFCFISDYNYNSSLLLVPIVNFSPGISPRSALFFLCLCGRYLSFFPLYGSFSAHVLCFPCNIWLPMPTPQALRAESFCDYVAF